jgi:NADH-quinone oxidoreductase subunit N
MASVTGFVVLGALVPVVTLAVVGDDVRSMFDGRYVVDEFSLVLKALFLLTAYVVILMSQTELEEGGYHQGEFYVLLLCSVLGMVMMASARDLVSIFVALELLSIPAYMMAAWRKRDEKSNEAGVKYYLLGVFASAILLYGMSLLFGTAGSTKLTEIGASFADGELIGLEVVGIVFVICGFGFKISAVPFHTWAPDTYEGAPLPVTAFLSVASKAAGFVALVTLVFLAFRGAEDVYEPLIWVLAALTMTIGNVLALRQDNIVRLAGIPPLGGWFAKFNAFRAVLDAETTSAYVLAAIAALNTVIAAAYYMRVLRVVWVDEVPDGDITPIEPPAPITAAIGITVIGTLVVGVLPGLLARFGDIQDLTGALGP